MVIRHKDSTQVDFRSVHSLFPFLWPHCMTLWTRFEFWRHPGSHIRQLVANYFVQKTFCHRLSFAREKLNVSVTRSEPYPPPIPPLPPPPNHPFAHPVPLHLRHFHVPQKNKFVISALASIDGCRTVWLCGEENSIRELPAARCATAATFLSWSGNGAEELTESDQAGNQFLPLAARHFVWRHGNPLALSSIRAGRDWVIWCLEGEQRFRFKCSWKERRKVVT